MIIFIFKRLQGLREGVWGVLSLIDKMNGLGFGFLRVVSVVLIFGKG